MVQASVAVGGVIGAADDDKRGPVAQGSPSVTPASVQAAGSRTHQPRGSVDLATGLSNLLVRAARSSLRTLSLTIDYNNLVSVHSMLYLYIAPTCTTVGRDNRGHCLDMSCLVFPSSPAHYPVVHVVGVHWHRRRARS